MSHVLGAASWAYLIIFVAIAVDAFVPVVPTQLLLITGGLLAAHGDLHIAAVVACGAAGAFTGDLACYLLGRHTVRRRATAIPVPSFPGAARLASRLRAAGRTVRIGTGFTAMLLCRFVPAGRMVAGFHAGRAGVPPCLFAVRAILAGLTWAGYGATVGMIGQEAITRSQWLPLGFAMLGAAVFATAGWLSVLVRPSRARTAGTGHRRGRPAPGPAPLPQVLPAQVTVTTPARTGRCGARRGAAGSAGHLAAPVAGAVLDQVRRGWCGGSPPPGPERRPAPGLDPRAGASPVPDLRPAAGAERRRGTGGEPPRPAGRACGGRLPAPTRSQAHRRAGHRGPTTDRNTSKARPVSRRH